MPEEPIRLSVTRLADFACRSGDLMPPGVDGPSAREGIRAHQKIQRKALDAAESDSPIPCDLVQNEKASRQGNTEQCHSGVTVESTLACQYTVGSTLVELVGRVDIIDLNQCRLTEIKTTLVPAEHLPDGQRELQWAQLMLYGFIFLESATDQSSCMDDVELELLHVNIRSDTQTSDVQKFSRAALQAHAERAMGVYIGWLNQVSHRRGMLRSSAALLQFPHDQFRSGQRNMAAAVFRASRDGQELMCEAPTGIGKTISALFPAGKSLAEKEIAQVVYLTAKVAGRLSALQSLNQLQKAGLQLCGIQIRAKQTTCFCTNGRCERDANGRCPMTLGFFDRLPDAREELLSLGIINDYQLDDVAWHHQLCPFELALQMLPWMHFVIADFNYVFDPLVRLPHFSESRKDTVLLIDEAHNLVDRSRSMFSAELSRVHCLTEASACRKTHPVVARSLDRLAQVLLTHAKHVDKEISVSTDTVKDVVKAASRCIESIVATTGVAPPLPDSNAELFRALCRYVAINEVFHDNHRCITEKSKEGRRMEVSLQLFCLDASDALNKQYRHFKASVMFSATLRPILFYRDTLGLPADTARLQLQSPFDPTRTYHAIADWIDTRYRNRQQSLAALISLIQTVSGRKQGSYLIFFPSYTYLELAYDAFTNASPEVETWRQTNDQSKSEQSEILDTLDAPGHRIGFAILGGVFGEGIDYVGNKLIGVVIVGTGLSGISTQTRLIADHYRQLGHDGFDFAYRYPGFTRVLQTAGRLIRTESDAGVIVLVDDRFKEPFYRALFPQEWHVTQPCDDIELYEDVDNFWRTLP